MGASLSFDGTSDYITAGAMTSLNGLTAFTICGWLNTNVLSTTQATAFCKNQQDGGSENLMFMSIRAGPLYFLSAQRDSGHISYIKVTTGSGAIDTWMHAVWTWDSAVGSQLLAGSKLYINGISQTLVNHISGTETMTSVFDSSENVQIGRRTSNTETWDGEMAYMQIFNRALTVPEMTELRYKPYSIANGLLAHWPLLDTGVKDVSGNGNNGTIVGDVIVSEDGPPVFYPKLKR